MLLINGENFREQALHCNIALETGGWVRPAPAGPDPQPGWARATGATAWLLGLPRLLKPSSFSLLTSFPWLVGCRVQGSA